MPKNVTSLINTPQHPLPARLVWCVGGCCLKQRETQTFLPFSWPYCLILIPGPASTYSYAPLLPSCDSSSYQTLFALLLQAWANEDYPLFLSILWVPHHVLMWVPLSCPHLCNCSCNELPWFSLCPSGCRLVSAAGILD